ncbi:MAG: phytanoyl-CoA dioxygenase family protein [Chromatiales bacterium]|nr:MAG: phytanoyl-CoA dioxygenase family protein [Chromatiales bacterium]
MEISKLSPEDYSVHVRKLTEAEIQAYRDEGVVLVPAFADQATVAVLRAAAERRAAAPSDHADELSNVGRLLSDQFLYNDIDEFREFVFQTAVAENAGRAMGVDRVRLYFDHLFVCAPQTPTDYYWHQDVPYWPVTGDPICSIWLSLTDCTPESSALQFVRGQEHQDQLYAQTPFGDEDPARHQGFAAADRPPPPDFHAEPERYEILSWDYKAGDAVLFNARIMHSSGGNSSKDVNRVAYSTRWIGDDVRFAVKPGWQDPLLFPDSDERTRDGDPLVSRKFPVAWSARD